ncbi:hypothetical protein SAMN04487888_10740 [Eubacterium callanderi]|uniref:hypothetical protein n=1 Tax=Eubacterium callanderi TaxID=53442 RepID=UPI0008E90FEC|nr:hypothetical protein [Eubacterium callanderi]SFP10566.1 hypothetical protein SAMN04487888_10740 [Eubacterium callanderi]
MKFIFDSHEEIRDYATNTLHMVSAPDQTAATASQPAYIDNSGLHPVDVQQIRQQALTPPTGQAPAVPPVQTVAQPAPAAPATPQPAPAQQPPVTPPPAQSAPAAQPLPTTAVAQEYTQDQISVAMAGLVSQGKQPEIMALIQGFGVSSLVELPKEQYGALAVKLREMGAQI